jgi:outer membrane biosynthesis protein TonB
MIICLYKRSKKAMIKVFGLIAMVLVVFCGGLFGQDSKSYSEPAKIVKTPNVSVPKEAIKSGLGGVVRVLVSIDEDGSVKSADAVIGPGSVCKQVTRADVVAMRSAAKEAALRAEFNPAQKNGQPQPSSMWLDFNFKGRDSAKSSSVVAKGDLPRYKVKDGGNYSAAPPDYTGPVNTGGTGETLTSTPNTDANTTSKLISGGVLNGKAQSLPRPPYPPAARAVRASGAVSIQVLIDENGEVFSAQAVSGHPLLRAASTVAACGAKFSPTTLEGSPVKVSGIITYNFVP